MATRRELIDGARKLLDSASVPATRTEIEWLLEAAEGCSRTDLIAYPDASVDARVEERFFAFVSRRLSREPVQYILGYCEFYGNRFTIDPSVLIPRPETELLVEYVLSHLMGKEEAAVIDIGTGSGCIAVSIKRGHPATRVVGVDVSGSALETARRNAAALGSEVAFREGNLFDPALSGVILDESELTSFDFVVSNPPYIALSERRALDPEILRFEPEIALFTARDSLAPYRALASVGASLLRAGGEIVLEIHEERSRAVSQVLDQNGFDSIHVHRDLPGKERMVTARWPANGDRVGR